MLSEDKRKMLSIMEKYRTDKDFRILVNSKPFSELSLIAQIALKDMLVTDDGTEIIKSDLSNHYHDYNHVDISTKENLIITCMNMAIAKLLHLAFKENNIYKYTDFNLPDIKTRIKGDLFSTFDKPEIIRFIIEYNKIDPNFLIKKTKEYFDMYHAHIRNGVGPNTFISLAHTFNTNIYLSEIMDYEMENKKKKAFFKKKK